MAIRTLGVARAYPELWLYHTDTALGWRRLRRIRHVQGERKVALGLMRRVMDQAGNHIGYQPIAPAAARVDMDVKSQPSSASISLREMRLNAEAMSRTMGLPAHRRDERIANGRAPEDLAERVQRKVQVFVHVTAVKGDILRVWPREMAAPLGAKR